MDYNVLIRQSGGNFSEPTCDRGNSTDHCNVALSDLSASPFSLSPDDSVIGKVRVKNLVGWSEYSTETPLKNAGRVRTTPLQPPTKPTCQV